MTVTWSQVGLPTGAKVEVLDLWQDMKPLATSASVSWTSLVPSHGISL